MTKPKLTIKESKFVKAYVETGDKSAAYKQAYDTKGNPATIYPEAVRTASKPHVLAAIEQAMAKLNITPDRALAPIDEALNHEDLEMRLKGSDRAIKLMTLGQKSEEPSVNLHLHLQEKRKRYIDGESV